MRDGYVFAGWNTEADGSGMEYEDGVNYTIAEDGILKTTVLYAQWGRPIKILTTMQEMTSINCSVSAENETKQLRDTRDGKYYWVAKLKDGNCWMTQNLDLDIPTEGLRVVDTDILADWNSSSVYPPTATAKGNASTDKSLQVATGTNSYDPGDFVITKPGSWYDCATGDDTLDGGWGCANVATRISDNYTADYDASTGGIMTSDTVTVSGAKYDAHYHVGNYYQFNTATAGTGAALTDEDGEGAVAAGSICPKGWKLPLSGGVYDKENDDYTQYMNGSFYGLLDTYGLAEGSEENSFRMISKPLYLMPGGFLEYDEGGLGFVGYSGNYYSRVSLNSEFAFVLTLDLGGVYPDNLGYARYAALSVRCVALGK